MEGEEEKIKEGETDEVEKHTSVQVQCAEQSGGTFLRVTNVFLSALAFCRIIAVHPVC